MHLGEVFTYSKCEIQRQVVALQHSERTETVWSERREVTCRLSRALWVMHTNWAFNPGEMES